MRVLLVNAFHYLRGGVERTYLDESRWLERAGHSVSHFATRDPRNLPSPTARFFAPGADFSESAGAMQQLSLLHRAIWSRPAEQAMEALLRETKPEIAHLHAPSRYLTPSILRPLERARVPVVMTLHDFKPWCTNRIQFAHGAPCERCKGGAHWHALATGCVQESRSRSAVAMVEAYAHDAVGAYRAVRRWIAPSRFVYEKAVAWGVPPTRVRLLHHGVEAPERAGAVTLTPPREAFALFSGRLSVEKGVRLLPAIAASIAPAPLLVAGEGPLGPWLQREAPANLKLLGHLTDADLASIRAAARVVVVPSLFYEHFGYAPAEAMLDKRAVVASRIGALPELVEHEVTGLLVPPGDAASVAAAVRRAMSGPAAAQWGEAGHARVLDVGNPQRHVESLLAIYDEALA
jgi:glycosyltransferase involved in cell wall biosynthesis